MTRQSHHRRGATILEALIAALVIAFGMVAMMAALLAAAQESRQGQNRQSKSALAEASLQRLHLAEKGALYTAAGVMPGTSPAQFAVGAAPWAPDPTFSADALDFSTGAYFDVLPDGTITRINSAADPRFSTPTPTCDTVPVGVFCREVLLARGVPPGSGIALPAGSRPVTAWVRVSRRTSGNLPPEIEATLYEVLVQ